VLYAVEPVTGFVVAAIYLISGDMHIGTGYSDGGGLAL
jgi:hypothetical protein